MSEIFEISDGILMKYNGDEAFVTIPEGIKKIRAGAFKRSQTGSVVMPDSLEVIGDDAFKDCRQLKSVVFPRHLKEIGFQAFRGCTSLTDVSLPDGITLIGSYAFLECSCLEEITIPADIQDICEDPFRNSGLKRLSVMPGAKKVPNRLCYGCFELESVSLPAGVEVIGSGAFANCTKLSDISIPDSVTRIEESAFYMCEKITEAKLPGSLDHIGTLAFAGTNVREFEVPEGVRDIPRCAFGIAVRKLSLPDSITHIDIDAFTGCSYLEEVRFSKADEYMYCFLGTPFAAGKA